MAKSFWVKAEKLYNCYNHCPWARPAHVPASVEVRCLCSELKPCQHEITTGEIREEENCREAAIKGVCQPTDGLAQFKAKLPSGSKEFLHAAGIKPMSPYSLLLALITKP